MLPCMELMLACSWTIMSISWALGFSPDSEGAREELREARVCDIVCRGSALDWVEEALVCR